jgi:hypothetical protein
VTERERPSHLQEAETDEIEQLAYVEEALVVAVEERVRV